MPSGLVEEQKGMSPRRDFGRDLVEVKLHSFGVTGRQYQRGAGSTFRTHRTEQIGRLGALIVRCPRT
jgi:hypothetical protein